ncbi:MAG: thioredoxin-disulfide reductase [Methanobacteriaceae archaeon]|nr:thioredoxin-disulfide reductase [Methanobacteriaceae archaeon]
MEEYDLIIIGAGPAGLSAAIYAGRQGMKTLVLEMMTGAGSGYMVPAMENYPGFEVISGKDLLALKIKQAAKHAIITNMEEVKSIKKTDDILVIESFKSEYKASSIIIATGSRHRRLKVPGETNFLGRGVCYCATCDGPLYHGKEVLMIGGGNAAAQEALYLQSIGCKVTLVHRRDELRAENYLKEKLKKKNIPIIWDSVVEEIKGDLVVKQVVLLNRKTGKKSAVDVDGIFIAIGDEPLNKVAVSLGVEIDKEGYIITDKFQRTNIPCVYAAGDITGGVKQWLVAASEGAVAALSAQEDLYQ